MNWIERMYELKGKDPYSQNGESIYLEYVANSIGLQEGSLLDIGGGDGFYLSNSRHLFNIGWSGDILDKETNSFVTVENIHSYLYRLFNLISIDIDGNDYWILEQVWKKYRPAIVIAEFNPAFIDSRTIKYNPDHVWEGTDYYGFSFDAGVKLAEANGYKVIFQIADTNMIMVRADLINVPIPTVTFKQSNFFEKSNRTDWVFV